jgi:hypothetical protein
MLSPKMDGESKMSKHKLAHKVPEYNVWVCMRQRCLNPKAKRFSSYGGRGITVCKEWNEFDAFLRDMGSRPSPNHSIDRIDNNLGYSKENCRWATASQQSSNRSSARIITDPTTGISRSSTEWEKHFGLPIGTIAGRLYCGWSDEKALTPKLLRKYDNR